MRWLGGEAWPPWWKSLTLMFQREVAERIVARPGSGAYGRLAVLAQWRAQAKLAMKVHRSAFVPPPKVMSAVVHIVPGAQPEGVTAAALERLTAAAFGQRRKMLRRSLASLPRRARGAGGARHRSRTARGNARRRGLRRDCAASLVPARPWRFGRRRALLGALGGEHLGGRAALDRRGELLRLRAGLAAQGLDPLEVAAGPLDRAALDKGLALAGERGDVVGLEPQRLGIIAIALPGRRCAWATRASAI